MLKFARLFSYSYPLLLLFLLAACIQPVSLSEHAAVAPSPDTALEIFVADLTAALSQRDYTALQAMMGASFVLAHGHSAGVERPPAIAIMQLRNQYLGVGSTVAFPSDDNLTTLVDGTDPLAVWAADAEIVRTLHVTGLGLAQQDEALLFIARDADDAPYWYGAMMLNAGVERNAAEADTTAEAGALPANSAVTETTQVAPAAPLVMAELLTTTLGIELSAPITMTESLSMTALPAVVVTATAEITPSAPVTTTESITAAASAESMGTALAETELTTTTVPVTATLVPAMATQVVAGGAQRVQLAQDVNTAYVRGVILPSRSRSYVLHAPAGQTMMMEMRSTGNNVNFAVTGMNDGQPYKLLTNDARKWTDSLPATQEYLVTVAATAAVPFELAITVVSE
ncbi:MAG: hypothetical protein R2932_43700 [Caldilineaceae bacterium]